MHASKFLSPALRLSCVARQLQKNSVANCQTSMLSSNAEEVLFDAVGSTRLITLNRPKALNALNLHMVEAILPVLRDWNSSPTSQVSHIIIKGSGDKAFCAGGDVKAVIDEGKKDPHGPKATHFFRREYILNHMIGTCPRPFIALIDGITMGGGVGLSVHAQFRVATEKTLFAMPETAIGLFPDVGGSYFLSRLPGGEGLYLGLTGHRLKGEDVYKAGIATHYITHEGGYYEKMTSELVKLTDPTSSSISDLLNSYHQKCVTEKPFSLAAHRTQIDSIFTSASVEEILHRLKEDNSEWALKTLATLKKMSPTSMKVTTEQLKRGKDLTLADCLKMELRIGRTMMLKNDFYEGVRALLIDKDNSPKWKPDRVEDVSSQLVQEYFGPMPDNSELEL